MNRCEDFRIEAELKVFFKTEGDKRCRNYGNYIVYLNKNYKKVLALVKATTLGTFLEVLETLTYRYCQKKTFLRHFQESIYIVFCFCRLVGR